MPCPPARRVPGSSGRVLAAVVTLLAASAVAVSGAATAAAAPVAPVAPAAPAAPAAPVAPAAPSAGAVVNEVYGGGGNTGATLRNDFVELANRGTTAVDLSTWSVQYHSGSATGTWQVTPLTGSLAPGKTYLVAEAAGTGGTADLPTPDATGTVALSGSSGTVALVSRADALTCDATSCATDASVVDLVGYGSAAIAEGAPAPLLTNTTSASRTAGAADTDVNSADFTAGTPTPTDAAGQTGGGGTPPPVATRRAVSDVQGTGWLSPLAGQRVIVRGVVTGVQSTGFFLQENDVDAVTAPAAASTAVLVFTGSKPTVAPNNNVEVTATVSEYYGGASDTANLSTTELTTPTVTVRSLYSALPTALDLLHAPIPDLYAPKTPAADNDIEHLTLTPSRSVLEYYEAHEAMLVTMHDVRVVGPSNQYGETNVTVKPNENRTPRGGVLSRGYAQPTGRIVLSTPAGALEANVGDVVSGTTAGPLQWTTFGGWTVEVTQLGTRVDKGLPRVPAPPAPANQLSVATYNVENLSPQDPQSKFDRLAEGVVTYLVSPDVVALEEIQDDDGPTDDGVVGADATLRQFTAAIVAAGGPRYRWRYISPVNDRDGGQPGGNIRVVFLFNPKRTSFVDVGTPSATVGTQVVTGTRGTQPALTISPGRIDPTDAAWDDSRKPLIGQFTFQGKRVFVIANHFDSKGGDQTADGRFQPPARSSEVQRLQQATIEHDFVQGLEAACPTAPVVVVGDLNDYQYSPAVHTLTTGTANGSGPAVLTDLIDTLPANQQYTYVFNGVSQVLDHILLSPSVTSYSYQPVHINAEYADQASDHDPQVVRLTVPKG